MPLDVRALYEGIRELVGMIDKVEGDVDRLEEAVRCLRGADYDLVRQTVERQRRETRIPWLVALPVERPGEGQTLASAVTVPPVERELGGEFSVVASDGSSMAADRHSVLRFFVLNLGRVILSYGQEADCQLSVRTLFRFREEEVYFDPLGKRLPIEEGRLGVVMQLEELSDLLELVVRAPKPAVALRDGSLILWLLQNEDPAFRDFALDDLLSTLDGFREVKAPLAGYISHPGSHDVTNMLRLLTCPKVSCAECPLDERERAFCAFLAGLTDRHLFARLLGVGERSLLFESLSAILDYYGAHRVYFLYLNVGGEIVRLEVPAWVVEEGLLDRVCAVVMDQCARSAVYPPYPPVLQEAHELAVITAQERQDVMGLLERELGQVRGVYLSSGKARSKRMRAV